MIQSTSKKGGQQKEQRIEAQKNAPSISSKQTAPHSLELCQTAALPKRCRKFSRTRVVDTVVVKTATANATGEEMKGGRRSIQKTHVQQFSTMGKQSDRWLR